VDLISSSCAIAADYTKRPNVFRLKLSTGGEFLFQAKDEEEMNAWIGKFNLSSGVESSSPTRAQTLPSSSKEMSRDEPKRRTGIFAFGKKK
jgi:spectrin beta